MQPKSRKLIDMAMDKRGYTLTKLAKKVEEVSGVKTTVQNISNKLSRDTVKFNELEMWLNVMGYELDIKESMLIDVASNLYPLVMYSLSPEELSQFMSLLRDDRVPSKLKMDIRNKIMHNSGENLRTLIAEFTLSASEFINITDFF